MSDAVAALRLQHALRECQQQAEDWQALRAIRNPFAYEYPDELETNASTLNLAIAAAGALEAILGRIQERLGPKPGIDRAE